MRTGSGWGTKWDTLPLPWPELRFQKLSVLVTSHDTLWAPCELKAWGDGTQFLTAKRGLPVIMLNSNLFLSLFPLCSPKALCLITIHISLIVSVWAQVLLFSYWEHEISQTVVTLTPQLYIKVRRKFYLKIDLNKCSVKGKIYFLLTFNLVYN